MERKKAIRYGSILGIALALGAYKAGHVPLECSEFTYASRNSYVYDPKPWQADTISCFKDNHSSVITRENNRYEVPGHAIMFKNEGELFIVTSEFEESDPDTESFYYNYYPKKRLTYVISGDMKHLATVSTRTPYALVDFTPEGFSYYTFRYHTIEKNKFEYDGQISNVVQSYYLPY